MKLFTLSIFNIVLFGALSMITGFAIAVWSFQVYIIEQPEDIWKKMGNFLGHVFAIELTVLAIVIIAEIIYGLIRII